MPKKNKLEKFSELLEFHHVYENFNVKDNVLHGHMGKEVTMKGKWRSAHFGNNQPLVVELACGRGEYSIGLAKLFPSKNFVGVDIKGARIWRGAKNSQSENLDNVAFLRTRIEFLNEFFNENEIDEIWITFADPFLRESKHNRRLSSLFFLDIYKKILKQNGIIHIKTDSPVLYRYSLETLSLHNDFRILYHEDNIYNAPYISEELEIKTYYELQHIENSRTIKYIQAVNIST